MDDILTTLCTLVDSERPNQVLFGSDVFKPTGYLAYSAPGKVQVSLKFRSEVILTVICCFLAVLNVVACLNCVYLRRGSWCTVTTAVRRTWMFCRRRTLS